MANAKQQENLLLTEHFTWPPISLLDDIINNSDETLHKCIDTTEATMLGVDPSLLGFSPSAGESEDQLRQRANLEIEEGAQKLETLISSALEKNLDRLEIWTLRNVLCLPREEGIEKWVRLGHYGVRLERADADWPRAIGSKGLAFELHARCTPD